MKKLFLLLALLLPTLAEAQVGHFVRPDCTTLTGVAPSGGVVQTTCLETTDPPTFKYWTGSTWTTFGGAGGGGSGDIEGVTAGTNLTGGGTSGTVTLNVINPVVANLTGNVTGNLTGNVTGNVSGSSGSTTGNAATASALAANGANCTAGSAPLGVDASGAAESCFDVATQTELGTHAGLTGTNAHGATTTNTASQIVSRDASGNFAAGTITAALSGNASTSTALAANGGNCSSGSAPLGVDASGAAESCFDVATQTELDNHVNDTAAAHAATAISVTPFGTIAATTVQAALEEIVSEATGGTDDQTAAEVPFTPAGNIAATDVQAAIIELDGEKQPLDSDLTALSGNSTDGFWAHTGAGTGAARTLTAGSSVIAITNPAGVAGNPTISVPGTSCTAYVAPGTNTLQAAIDALPDTGGVICLGAGTYTETGAAPTIGNGTTSAVSTKHGVIIRGVAPATTDIISTFSTASATVIDCTGTTNGTCFKIVGPLEGWGLENLQINGAITGSESYGVSVVSAKFGRSQNLYIKGFKRGIDSTTHATFSGGGNFDSFGNIWENIQITVPTGGTHYGMVLGTAGTGANTDFNHFKNTFIWPAASGTACMQMNWTDGNVFENFVCVANGDIFLDYTAGSGRVPNNNYWYGLEMGGAAVTNVGSPAGGDKLNYIFGFSETNASVCPNIAGTLVYGCSTGYVQDQVIKGLTASRPVIADSNKKLSSGTYSGTTTEVATVTGTKTTSQQLAFDANGNVIASGTAIGGSAAIQFVEPGLRLTLTTAVPVTTADVTAAGTLYYTPFKSCRVVSVVSAVLANACITEISLSLTLTSGKNYDVFVSCTNATTCALALSAAWTNDTTRADALATETLCGCLVLGSDHTKLWIGTIRASASNVTEDSAIKGFVWNAYQQVFRPLLLAGGTSTAYASATIRQYDGSAANQVEFITGVAAPEITAYLTHAAGAGGGTVRRASVGIGLDTTTAFTSAAATTSATIAASASVQEPFRGAGLGYHFLSVNQAADDAGTITFYNFRFNVSLKR